MTAIERWVGISRLAVKERLQYRFDFFMTLVSTLLFAAMYYMVWYAVYQSSMGETMPWEQLITYIMIGQAVSFARWSPADRAPVYAMSSRLRNGDVAIDLIRPVGFQMRRFLESWGFFLVEMLWVNVPCMLLFIYVLGIQPPAGTAAAIGYAASLLVGFLVAYSINSIVMMLSFWTTNAQGLQITKKAVITLLAGTIIPFEFFPDWLRTAAEHLPFQSMAYIPLSIYIGRIEGVQLAGALLEQLGWAALMLLLCRWLWSKAERRIVIYGG